MIPTRRRGLQPKRSHPTRLSSQTSSHPVLFVKGKLPDVFILSSGNSPHFEHVKAFSQGHKPVSVSTSQLLYLRYLFKSQLLFPYAGTVYNLARNDALRLRRTPPLVTFLAARYETSAETIFRSNRTPCSSIIWLQR
jgi:hypothetical protein